jgi:DNA-directed RNA polymerase subunit RPC12/RpoP
MQSLRFERRPDGQVAVESCRDCQLLWFDALESTALAPGGTLALFAAIATSVPAPPKPLAARLPCPRCRTPLVPTQDLVRSVHFSYFRCPVDHGRLTPFLQFLREKQFIATLPPTDLARLKSAVRVIRCASCGAPVDLEHDTACRYCGSAIAVLDPGAVARTVAALEAGAAQRHAFDPLATADAILAAARERDRAATDRTAAAPVVDLVALGIAAIADALQHA